MIVLYESTEDNFSTLGLGVLTPTECFVSEEAAWKYELSLTQPAVDSGFHLELRPGRIIKAPSPVRDSPEIFPPDDPVVSHTYEIWKCVTSGRLYIRSKPNGSKIGALTKGQEVLKIAVDRSTGDDWFKITTMDQSVTGYVYPNLGSHIVKAPAWDSTKGYNVGDYVTYSGNVYKCITAYSAPLIKTYWWMVHGNFQLFSNQETSQSSEGAYLQNTGRHKTIKTGGGTSQSAEGRKFELTRYQLFRIYSIERSSEDRVVRVMANHISYDLAGVVASIGASNIDVPLTELFQYFKQTSSSESKQVSHDPGFDYTDYTGGRYKGPWLNQNILSIINDPEHGILKQNNAKLLRDNKHIYILPSSDRNLGFAIRYGKNLITADFKIDTSDIITRILPRGSLSNGNAFTAPAVDSANINEFGIMAKTVKYNYRAAGETATAQDKLAIQQMARDEFTNDHIDVPKQTLESEFVHLESTNEFARFANMYGIHLYDLIPVVDNEMGIGAKDPLHPTQPVKVFAMTAYEFDVLKKQYSSVELGDLEDIGN